MNNRDRTLPAHGPCRASCAPSRGAASRGSTFEPLPSPVNLDEVDGEVLVVEAGGRRAPQTSGLNGRSCPSLPTTSCSGPPEFTERERPSTTSAGRGSPLLQRVAPVARLGHDLGGQACPPRAGRRRGRGPSPGPLTTTVDEIETHRDPVLVVSDVPAHGRRAPAAHVEGRSAVVARSGSIGRAAQVPHLAAVGALGKRSLKRSGLTRRLFAPGRDDARPRFASAHPSRPEFTR